jgi:hypothetical protein
LIDNGASSDATATGSTQPAVSGFNLNSRGASPAPVWNDWSGYVDRVGLARINQPVALSRTVAADRGFDQERTANAPSAMPYPQPHSF